MTTCPICGAHNQIVNQCRCDPNNLPTRLPATKSDCTRALKALRQFIGPNQLYTVADCCRGEEKQFFFDKMVELANLVANMPKTYEQDGKGDEAIVTLHYFTPGADWFITEKDSDPDNTGQHQAFGLADIFQDGGELGYISIPELLANGAELDFHFTPRTLATVRAKRNAASCCSTPDPAAVEFNEADCSGVFDGFTVTSDADPGL